MSVEIHPQAIVEKGAELGVDVNVGAFSIVGPHVQIGDSSTLLSQVNIVGHTRVGRGNEFHPFCTIGVKPQDLSYQGEPTRVEIGDNNVFREYVSVHRGTMKKNQTTIVGSKNLLMNYVHLGHDVTLGSHVVVANSVNLAGGVWIQDHVTLGGGCNVAQFVTIGEGAYIGGLSAVDRDILPFCAAYGNRIRLKGINIVKLRRLGYSKQQVSEAVDFYRTMEATALSPQKFIACKEVMGEFSGSELVQKIARFIERSEVGISSFAN